MITSGMIKSTKNQIALIIDSLVSCVLNPDTKTEKLAYYHHSSERQNFIVYLYLFKLLINDNEYLKDKYNNYLSNKEVSNKKNLNVITNINEENELDLILSIKNKLYNEPYYYDLEKNQIVFKDNYYIEVNWLITIISLILDNKSSNISKDIKICYTIPNKNTKKLNYKEDIKEFLKSFTHYTINIKYNDKTKELKDNSILLVKNAAINYLKHLKQFEHGLETEESYQIFYNLLRTECRKQGFELEETKTNLLNELKTIEIIDSYINDDFYKYNTSKQIHIIENIIWQSSNDQTLLEYINNSLDSLVELISVLRINKHQTYEELKYCNNLKDIPILLILIVSKFLLTYLNSIDDINYNLLDLSNIKPEYMSSIYNSDELELKQKIKKLNVEVLASKKEIDKLKKERTDLNKETIGEDKYQKELERIVSNINRYSIIISSNNHKISDLTKIYDDIIKEREEKYKNATKYLNNKSVIRHICNSIIGCNFYIKTNNQRNVLENIVIFEDYEKTENSFYLEVTFKELLKICNPSLLNGIIDQSDMPKLNG